jgi:hypothetical protein
MSLTMKPTGCPTNFPTLDGEQEVEKEETVATVKAAMEFPLTLEEALNPVVQESIEYGIAASLGKEPEDVKMTSVNGQALRGRRRYVGQRQLRQQQRQQWQQWQQRDFHARSRKVVEAGVEIEFEVISSSDNAADIQELKNNVVQAVGEGSVVANVQKRASERGVLVEALKAMQRQQPIPTVVESSKVIVVTVVERYRDANTDAPSFSPTKIPTQARTVVTIGGEEEGASILDNEIGFGAICASGALLCLLCTRFCFKSLGDEKFTAKVDVAPPKGKAFTSVVKTTGMVEQLAKAQARAQAKTKAEKGGTENKGEMRGWKGQTREQMMRRPSQKSKGGFASAALLAANDGEENSPQAGSRLLGNQAKTASKKRPPARLPSSKKLERKVTKTKISSFKAEDSTRCVGEVAPKELLTYLSITTCPLYLNCHALFRSPSKVQKLSDTASTLAGAAKRHVSPSRQKGYEIVGQEQKKTGSKKGARIARRPSMPGEIDMPL